MTKRKKMIDWQNRYITPVLLVLGIILVAASWAAGGISWPIAIALIAFVSFALVAEIRKIRR